MPRYSVGGRLPGTVAMPEGWRVCRAIGADGREVEAGVMIDTDTGETLEHTVAPDGGLARWPCGEPVCVVRHYEVPFTLVMLDEGGKGKAPGRLVRRTMASGG